MLSNIFNGFCVYIVNLRFANNYSERVVPMYSVLDALTENEFYVCCFKW